MTATPAIDPALFKTALADVRKLRRYGTYQTPTRKAPPTRRPQCNSERGYQLHGRHGEEPCDGCRQVAMEAQRRRRSTGTSAP